MLVLDLHKIGYIKKEKKGFIFFFFLWSIRFKFLLCCLEENPELMLQLLN